MDDIKRPHVKIVSGGLAANTRIFIDGKEFVASAVEFSVDARDPGAQAAAAVVKITITVPEVEIEGHADVVFV